MKTAQIPADEESRLKALYEYEILDTKAEQVFDDLTQLASEICETPISLISLVDPQRQWFKSKYGIDVDETEREIAFCSHAILQDHIFEIPNALLDERFHDNPLVVNNPNIRFYAGAPLVTPKGNTIGTLCVISDKPKKLNQNQINALTILGREVITQLELRLNNRRLTSALEQQKIHNEELEVLKKEADSANTLKGQFLANMTHELRTPLHGILNLAEFGLAEETSLEKDNALKSILNSANILSSIVNDILDFSKIEAGKLDIENINFNLKEVVNDLFKPLIKQASAKGIKLTLYIDEKVAATLKGDPVRISQILNNLCSNAIKFTNQGQVNLKVSVQSSSLIEQDILFEIIDTGIGISEAAQQNLFQDFHQADASISRCYGGTGLGLSICAKLSQLMKGKIGFTSKEGEGSIFTYQQSFETHLLYDSLKQKKEITNLQGCTILIAEDNKINQLIVSKMLQAHNANVVITENGKECVDYFNTNPVDLIFMDIQMPVMDGVQATKAIRAQQGDKTTPIIALTANTLKQNIEHYLDIGMDGYLAKPFDKDKLNSLLNIYNPNNLNLKKLAVKISDPNISSKYKLNQTCQELKKLIPNANRVSLWLLNHEYTAINCLICLDENEVVTNDMVLKAQDFPAYFNYILGNQVLDASDARNNEVTKDLNKSYFEPFNVYSLLDYIYFIDDKPLGVICCESVDSKVSWDYADKEALIKIADVTTLFLSKQLKS
ncbi:response regulator [Pseudoalteromonas sp. SG43-7]|uniref:histidine kinase n=1 Tax=Pseudoalteromonas rhizosphaerae TaxID=2518973 RepID=A0ABW8L230_9GAMM|nr:MULTISPECIES: response regulator [unclassified Pseudoalteromonas]MBB1343457.1 response regulator [Pseudoalteromonas sp. SR45-6]MBB1423593.1 response regulator [Pseudoalteromonas sp. SG43-7]MBB1436020.1 response regulator [Pseudoalteromonas sp. SG43-6]